ncbi:MAG TPA: FHA domain-containing protein [Rhizomicrobium sp.]|nr:FHA domain-containing protein [Rhizomicrobium sp.]
MSFILRQISRRAGGGPDIVRERPLVNAEPIIGRGADCDIPLNDLAVSLHHARLREAAMGHIVVEALGPVGLLIDGTFTRREQVSLAAVPRIVIGSHLLELCAGQPDEIVVTVSQIAVAEGVAAADPRSVFSLSGAISKRRASYALLLLILLLCLALPVYAFLHGRATDTVTRLHPDRQWSSGPLSRGHAFLEKNCNACHVRAFVSVRDSACLACHQAGLTREAALTRAQHIKTEGGLFAAAAARDHAGFLRLLRAKPDYSELRYKLSAAVALVFNHPQNRCASCHTEHIGAKGQRGRLEQATLPSSAQVHVDCVECHSGLSQRLPDTKLGDVQSWRNHPQFRPFVTVSPGPDVRLARMAYSRPLFDRTGLFFSHQQHLAQDGGVTRMAQRLGPAMGYGKQLECANCHHARGETFVPIEMKRDCSMCHSLAYAPKRGGVLMLPHGKPSQVVMALEAFYAEGGPQNATNAFGLPLPTAKATPVAQGMPQPPSELIERGVRAAFSKGGTCYGCHVILSPPNRASLLYGIGPVNLLQRYLPSGDFNHRIRQHKQDAQGRPLCTECHKAEHAERSTDLLVPRVAACRACHGRPKPLTATPAGTNCSECHAYHQPGTSARLRSDGSLTF